MKSTVWSCAGKQGKYIGETYRSIKERIEEHHNKMRNKDQSSILYQHCKEFHGGKEQHFNVKICRSFHSDPMLRQINESIRIKEENLGLNTKGRVGK